MRSMTAVNFCSVSGYACGKVSEKCPFRPTPAQTTIPIALALCLFRCSYRIDDECDVRLAQRVSRNMRKAVTFATRVRRW